MTLKTYGVLFVNMKIKVKNNDMEYHHITFILEKCA